MKRIIRNTLLSDFISAAVCLVVGFALVLMYTGCSEEGRPVSGGASVEPSGLASLENITIKGRAAKASTIPEDDGSGVWTSAAEEGTVIRMSELDSVTLDTTGVSFYSRCTGSMGEFRFDSVTLHSPYVMLELAPYVENVWWEWDGNWSFTEYDSLLELYTVMYTVIVDLRQTRDVDINVMTYLESARLRYLVSQGESFDSAKQHADGEIMKMLGMYGEPFVFDKSEYVENRNSLIAVNVLNEFIYDWKNSAAPTQVANAFGSSGTLSGEDSVRAYFAREFYRWSRSGSGWFTDSMQTFLSGFMASLYGLGECTTEKEGVSSLEPAGGTRSIKITCNSGKWVVERTYTISNAVNSTFDVMTDSRDGRNYKTVTYQIKDYSPTWLAENLKYEFADGLYSMAAAMGLPDSVVYLSHDECVESYQNQAYCQTLTTKDGIDYVRLGEAIDSAKSVAGLYQGICPDGWHMPSAREWEELLSYLQEKLGEEDGDHYFGSEILARAGFEENEPEGRLAYALKMDKGFTDYYREWAYEKNEAWAVAVTFADEWYFVSQLPDDSFFVRCVKD